MNLEALIDYLCRRGGDQSGSESQGGDAAYISPTRDRGFALTGIESLLLSAPRADLVEPIIPLYTGGDAMPAEIVKDIVGTRDVYDALSKTRSALREMGLVSESASGGPNDSVACNDDTTSERTTRQTQRPMNNHPAIRHYPTHYFVRTVNSRGPPPGWSYYSVNLGLKSEAMNIRYTLNRADPDTLRREFDSLEVQGRTKSNTLHLFDEASEKWTEVPCGRLKESSVMTNGEPSSLPSDEEEPPMERTTLRVLTWNVQFNRYSGERTPLGRTGIDWCTTTRYLALSEVLSKTDADIIAMQEVEPSWCSFLCQQPWVRTGYVLSSQERSHAIAPWGVMMLLRKDLNIKAFEHANVPAFSGHISVMPEATLTLSKHTPPVMVSSMHLLAPYNQNNVNNREVQLENMLKHLKELANQTTDSSSAPSHVLMGDFNDTPARFFRIPKELGYRDAWEELHPHWMSAEASSSSSSVATAGEADGAKRGYTIDGDANPYAGRIIEKEFYGRPDRVLYSSKHLQPTCAELVGTQSVLEVLKEKGITRQVDHPQDDIPSYLFPSDHFGMLVEFQVL
ncbi:unnamed protein product [Phytomonas sp. EM1]|nr:unnamed protein product [Phytomonas sp. EM1]|eukprot:CCW63988.1 unnamed protein product [Phytomonas sp. isolate EM1]